MIYLDAAAAIKLVHNEAETPALDAWLNERIDIPRVSSQLIEVEVPRALRRCAPDALPRVPMILGTIHRVGINDEVRAQAAAFADTLLRSLDAIHLATALLLARELNVFVTYDKRLLAAAEAQGLRVASPGA